MKFLFAFVFLLISQIAFSWVNLCLRNEHSRTKNKMTTEPRDPFSEMKEDRVQISSEIPKALNITNAVIVGVTKKGSEYIALIRALNNKVYFLKAGDKLHDGVVLKIDNNAVTFRQYKGYRSILVKKELRPFPD
jgi:Tfp pilus assembly protein PilP